MNTELATFVEEWKETESNTRQAFVELLTHLESLADTTLEFNARPGVSYSLRPRHAAQDKRPLFAMVDVIDDDPDDRWLSVCFYGEMVEDPDEAGDLVPEGLLGEDGYCFDLYEYDADEVAYLKERLSQAHGNAPE
ncbi:MAG TPA: hypothetical protein DHV36_24870 [Desulfobacteraceae bacterium]|nr:hypothetical protein [Desulfobacteraceae bacterium]